MKKHIIIAGVPRSGKSMFSQIISKKYREGKTIMGEKTNIQGYLEYVHAPWGKLFYKLAWHNIECKGKRILDFGSGFGVTADHWWY